MALEQSTTFWSDFQSEFSLDHELPMSEDAGWTVAEQPIIVACASCSLPVLASAFARHWGSYFHTALSFRVEHQKR